MYIYHIESFFANIPLQEAIENVCRHVYQQCDPPKYSIEIFIKLLQIAYGGYFFNKGKLCCQIDGVAMGSPLGPTLAIFFLALLENQFMTTNFDFLTCSLRQICR